MLLTRAFIIALPCALFLSGCATSPIYAKLSDGRWLQGYGLNGSFELRNLDGLSCKGTYPQLTFVPTVDLDVSCSDGRTGKILMNLNPPNYDSGYGRGKLSDGTTFQVFMGEVKDNVSAPNLLK